VSHLALARKYRPQTFDAMIGQGAVVQTLKNALNTGKIHPAYIFSGIRGIGKTTAARLFAKGLNCERGPTAEPCGECPSCGEIAASRSMDVLEIDAATHTQVDKIRDLTEAARYMPARDHYRVFIIDEVHMLSTSSFNALLKTLEEPPPHAVFLLATTEPQKVPETIHSRAQHFQFRRVPAPQVARFLGEVCEREGIQAEPEALELLARSGEGSVRDSLTLLDRLNTYAEGAITEAATAEVLGLLGREALISVAQLVADGDSSGLSAFVDSLRERGQSLERFLSDFCELVRQLARIRAGQKPEAVPLDDPRLQALASRFSLEDLLRLWDLTTATMQKLKGAPEPEALLELQLIKAALLPKILPMEQLLKAAREIEPDSPAAPPPPRDPQAAEDEGAEGLRFKALIPFQRMDDTEARSFEGQDDKAQKFKDLIAKSLPMAAAALRRSTLSLDPEGVLHLVLPVSATTAGALLTAAERRRQLEEMAREAGYPGRVSVETAPAEAEPEPSPAAERRPAGPAAPPSGRSQAVQNVVKILGGQVVSTTLLSGPDSGGGNAEPE
jgi:DNA polymerase-3 subunit gamma/tau